SRSLHPAAHMPNRTCAAYEHRTSASRIPSGDPVARRIEQRVAGGDVTPSLMLAAILGSALVGIEERLTPPAPITGNAYALDLPLLPDTWSASIDVFEKSATVRRIFPEELIRNLVMTKRQELRYMEELSPEEQTEIYLDTV